LQNILSFSLSFVVDFSFILDQSRNPADRRRGKVVIGNDGLCAVDYLCPVAGQAVVIHRA